MAVEEEEKTPPPEVDEEAVSGTGLSDASAEERDVKDKEATFIDIAAFLKKYNPAPAVPGRPDTLHDRYFIKYNNLVPEFSRELAVACEAVDDVQRNRPLFGIILTPDLPYRTRNMDELSGVEHPNMLSILACGHVFFSHNELKRRVVVFDRLSAPTMRQFLGDNKRFITEKFIMDEVIAPVAEVLKLYKDKGICHGSINLDTVYFSDRIIIGESISQPCGFAQHYRFETPERSQASPFGKGEGGIAADCYALGVLVLHIIFGLDVFDRIDEQTYLSRRLALGSYNTLVGVRETKGLEDFLKGVLNDDPKERWTPEIIEQWVKGKKFNLLTPSVLREGQRPFQFMGQDFFNRRALANSISQHWEEAKAALRSIHLARWVEVSLHRQEMAESLRRVVDRTGGTRGTDKSNNELIARSLSILDPEGPVRYGNIAAFVDGLGVILADAFRNKDQKLIQTCIEVLDYNYFSYLNDASEENKQRKNVGLLWRIQNAARYLRMPAMGFGIERILYELNPTLPCQSKLFADETVVSLDQVLFALDRMGIRKTKNFEYLDRHIAAYVAVKLDIAKEVKINELARIPALAQNPQLIVLYMLAQAQKKIGRPRLKGLTAWAALRVLPLLDNFHSRTIRRKTRGDLKVAAKSGDLDKIFEILMDARTINEDMEGFRKAVNRFIRNDKTIKELENAKKLKFKALRMGMALALTVSYTTFLVTAVLVAKMVVLEVMR